VCSLHAPKPNVRVPTIHSEKLSEFFLDRALRPQQNLPHASRIELRNKNVVTVVHSLILEAMNSANDSPLLLERVLVTLSEESFRTIGAKERA
jgi:hypothetical protein